MPVTPNTQQRGKSATLRFDAERFDARCRELGATTDVARAELCGVDRATLHRYRKGLTVPLLPAAVEFAARLDLTVSDLWKDAA